MSYGENLPRLNPLAPELLAQALARFCPEGASVLDLGCGRGATMVWLRQNSGCKVEGLEADPVYAAACGAALGRVESLPFPDASFDAIIMECVFSLLDGPEQAAREIARALRPGGVLLLSDLYGRQGRTEIKGSQLLRHIYAASDINDIVSAAGLVQLDFTDHSPALTTLLAQMIMEGTACDCLDDACRRQLRLARAGYGLWVFRKEAADAGI